MKRILLLSIVIICFNQLKAQTQEQQRDENKTWHQFRPKFIVSYYPLEFFASNIKMGLEWQLTDKFTLKTNLRLGSSDLSNFYRFDANYNNTLNSSPLILYGNTSSGIRNYFGASGELQMRYYIAEKSPNGFYGGFLARYKNITFNNQYTIQERITGTTGTYYQSKTIDKNYIINAFGFGAIIGFQGFIGKKIAVDLYMGSVMMRGSEGASGLRSGARIDRFSNGVGAVLGANVGLAFK
jgi:hypothetical protein